MSFWGVEIKPGKPYTLQFDSEKGRLHLSQATLGHGPSTKKSFLRCKTGNDQAIYLCSLLPNRIETCALNLEFDEEDEVIFSVEGSHGIHLSGFFLGDPEDSSGDDYESDSYGEDISGTESGDSFDYDSEAGFEDDIDIYPSSTAANSGVIIEEILDDDKPAIDKKSSKQGKKKIQAAVSDKINSERQPAVKSNAGDHTLKSEDEDGFPIKANNKNKSDSPSVRENPKEIKDQKSYQKAKKKKEKDEASIRTLKRKLEAVVEDEKDKSKSGQQPGSSPADTTVSETDMKQKKEKKKKKKTDQKEEPMQLEFESHRKQSTEKDLPIDANSMGEENNNNKKIQKTGNKVVATADQAVVDKKGFADEKTKVITPIQVRTFANRLVIEEMSMDKPDGKKAVPGKKVSVNYIGKLKNSGEIFDSNVGKAPYMFRLGVGQVIKGWDCGINGMRIGDKRRLTIPPAMGYGTEGTEETIPPNSWLVFDVELVAVD